MHRVLKPGRWASVVFHNSDDRVWNAIRDAATDAGFSLENAVAFDKEQRSFKGIKGEKGEERVSNFDIVLNLRKAPVAGQRRNNGGAGGLPADVQERILPIIQAHLRSLADGQPSGATSEAEQRTTQYIHSRVIQALVPSDASLDGVSYGAVEAVLRSFCRQVEGRWYLPGEQVRRLNAQGELLITVRDEASAIEWLRAELRSGPKLEGDLVDRLRMASPTVRLPKTPQQLLEENFTYDERRGRWRLPTPAELERTMDVTRAALQRRVRAFVEAPTPQPAATLVSWMRECYQRELYAEAHDLFSHIPREDVDETTYAELRRLDRVAGLRAGERSRQMTLPDGG
jgi:hypothetical protein